MHVGNMNQKKVLCVTYATLSEIYYQSKKKVE